MTDKKTLQDLQLRGNALITEWKTSRDTSLQQLTGIARSINDARKMKRQPNRRLVTLFHNFKKRVDDADENIANLIDISARLGDKERQQSTAQYNMDSLTFLQNKTLDVEEINEMGDSWNEYHEDTREINEALSNIMMPYGGGDGDGSDAALEAELEDIISQPFYDDLLAVPSVPNTTTTRQERLTEVTKPPEKKSPARVPAVGSKTKIPSAKRISELRDKKKAAAPSSGRVASIAQ